MLSYRSKHNFISTAELNNLAVNTGVGQTEKIQLYNVLSLCNATVHVEKTSDGVPLPFAGVHYRVRLYFHQSHSADAGAKR